MNNRILALALMFLLSLLYSVSSQCLPLFPRMFYNPDSSQILPNEIDLIFMFNTNISCPSSYIQVFYHNKVAKTYCQQNKLQTIYSNQSVEFVQYVQKCSVYLAEDKDIVQFSYKPFGCKSSQQCQPYSTDSLAVELPSSNYPLKMIVLADWGPLTHEKYEPLNKTLIFALQKRKEQKQKSVQAQWRINGMIMQGDYAYNFETNNCQNYLLFMRELERVSRYWPMIPNSGNHETGHSKSMYLFQNSFIIGNLSTSRGSFKRAQKYRFRGRFTLIQYDPFLEIYGKSTQAQYMSMKSTIQQYILTARNQFPDQFVLMGSHYPIRCAQVNQEHCYATLKTLSDLFDFLSTPSKGKGLVDLYLGAHMHEYERLFPYSQGKFVIQQSPFSRGRLVSVVEGVAGNSEYLIDELIPADFTANYRVGETGFGILTIFGNSSVRTADQFLKYQHISTLNTFTVTDEFQILNKFLPTGNLLVQND